MLCVGKSRSGRDDRVDLEAGFDVLRLSEMVGLGARGLDAVRAMVDDTGAMTSFS